MARALQTVVLRRIENRTREMRALLAVRHVRILRRPDHDALFAGLRILKELHPANRDFAHPGDQAPLVYLRFPEPAFDQDPDVAREHPEASQREELCKLPSADIA